MNPDNAILQAAMEYLFQARDIVLEWLLSPAAWSQFALLLIAFGAAYYARRWLSPVLTSVLTPPEGADSYLSRIRRFALLFLPLLLPLLAYGFTALGEQATRAAFGSGDVIAFGKRVFVLLAARTLVHKIISEPFLKLLGRYVLIPAAVLFALGLFGPTIAWLDSIRLTLGNIDFSALVVVRGLIFGAVLFWLGRWSNDQSATYIKSQEHMRPALRELSARAAEIVIFGIAFVLLMNIMGIDLTTLAFLGGVIGVGLGFGLQKIASNFISGVILLLEGQATVGDYVELDGGEAGTIVRITMRATILETFDGKWIVVPNEDFITTRVVNFSDSGSANRFEVAFSVSYDTDISTVPDIIEPAVAQHPAVLTKPFPPDCELRGFGDNGIEFAVEFWVDGLDDGRNKYTSQVRFLVWNALRDAGIEIPFPQRVVHLRGEA